MTSMARYMAWVVQKCDGDWRSVHCGWKVATLFEPCGFLTGVLHVQAIRPMQQFHGAHHKNAAHCALKMDAMEFKAHTPRLDGICIASCDSDFTGIALTVPHAPPTAFFG